MLVGRSTINSTYPKSYEELIGWHWWAKTKPEALPELTALQEFEDFLKSLQFEAK